MQHQGVRGSIPNFLRLLKMIVIVYQDASGQVHHPSVRPSAIFVCPYTMLLLSVSQGQVCTKRKEKEINQLK